MISFVHVLNLVRGVGQDPTTGAVRPAAIAEMGALEAADDVAEENDSSAAEESKAEEEVLQGFFTN
jgi:hypothetical protein